MADRRHARGVRGGLGADRGRAGRRPPRAVPPRRRRGCASPMLRSSSAGAGRSRSPSSPACCRPSPRCRPGRRCSPRCRWRPGAASGRSDSSALVSIVAGQTVVRIQPGEGDDPEWLTLTVNAIFTAARPRLGHVHRVPPRADLDAPPPRRAGRGGAGAPGRPGAGQRAGRHRARDARRAGPPDLPDLHERRRPGIPRGPLRRADARQRRGHPVDTPTRRSPTCAASSACSATYEPASRSTSRSRRTPTSRPGDDGPGVGAAHRVPRPRRSRRPGGAGRRRPDRLPDRPGGHHQRPQARPRRPC